MKAIVRTCDVICAELEILLGIVKNIYLHLGAEVNQNPVYGSQSIWYGRYIVAMSNFHQYEVLYDRFCIYSGDCDLHSRYGFSCFSSSLS
jgi:hypothetical protein